MKPFKKYQPPPPPRVIAIDVDKTLQIHGQPNLELIEWVKKRKADGFYIMLWSSRGEAHSRRYAELFGITELFNLICSKPGFIVDDQGWSWIQYTRVLAVPGLLGNSGDDCDETDPEEVNDEV